MTKGIEAIAAVHRRVS